MSLGPFYVPGRPDWSEDSRAATHDATIGQRHWWYAAVLLTPDGEDTRIQCWSNAAEAGAMDVAIDSDWAWDKTSHTVRLYDPLELISVTATERFDPTCTKVLVDDVTLVLEADDAIAKSFQHDGSGCFSAGSPLSLAVDSLPYGTFFIDSVSLSGTRVTVKASDCRRNLAASQEYSFFWTGTTDIDATEQCAKCLPYAGGLPQYSTMSREEGGWGDNWLSMTYSYVSQLVSMAAQVLDTCGGIQNYKWGESDEIDNVSNGVPHESVSMLGFGIPLIVSQAGTEFISVWSSDTESGMSQTTPLRRQLMDGNLGDLWDAAALFGYGMVRFEGGLRLYREDPPLRNGATESRTDHFYLNPEVTDDEYLCRSSSIYGGVAVSSHDEPIVYDGIDWATWTVDTPSGDLSQSGGVRLTLTNAGLMQARRVGDNFYYDTPGLLVKWDEFCGRNAPGYWMPYCYGTRASSDGNVTARMMLRDEGTAGWSLNKGGFELYPCGIVMVPSHQYYWIEETGFLDVGDGRYSDVSIVISAATRTRSNSVSESKTLYRNRYADPSAVLSEPSLRQPLEEQALARINQCPSAVYDWEMRDDPTLHAGRYVLLDVGAENYALCRLVQVQHNVSEGQRMKLQAWFVRMSSVSTVPSISVSPGMWWWQTGDHSTFCASWESDAAELEADGLVLSKLIYRLTATLLDGSEEYIGWATGHSTSIEVPMDFRDDIVSVRLDVLYDDKEANWCVLPEANDGTVTPEHLAAPYARLGSRLWGFADGQVVASLDIPCSTEPTGFTPSMGAWTSAPGSSLFRSPLC